MKLEIVAKCDDRCKVALVGDGVNVEKHGYVPRKLGIGGGDYVRLTIDIQTGKIEGWVPLRPDEVSAILE
jgi:hypothetical protein